MYTTMGIIATSSICALLFENVGIFYEPQRDNYNSALIGWTDAEWIDVILLFGFVVGVLCISGFNYAMEHISPLLFSTLSLIDPTLTGIISYIAGIESVPNSTIFVGGFVIMIGVAVITVGIHRRDGEGHGSRKTSASPKNAQYISSNSDPAGTGTTNSSTSARRRAVTDAGNSGESATTSNTVSGIPLSPGVLDKPGIGSD